MPKLRLMTLATAVLLPKLVGALSYPVLCFISMLFHIIVLPALSSRRIRFSRWLIEGDQKILSTNIK
jgi:hypothetical protein